MINLGNFKAKSSHKRKIMANFTDLKCIHVPQRTFDLSLALKERKNTLLIGLKAWGIVGCRGKAELEICR